MSSRDSDRGSAGWADFQPGTALPVGPYGLQSQNRRRHDPARPLDVSGSAYRRDGRGVRHVPDRTLSRGVTVDEPCLRIVRLRLPGLTELLYVLRQHGRSVDDDRYPGAEHLLAADGHVVAATSPSLLIATNVGHRALAGPLHPGMLVLDVRAVGHRLARSPWRWTGTTRGTIVDFDDLVWDAAATCEDLDWAEQVRDGAGFHALYDFVWGNATKPPPVAERQALWGAMVTQLLDHLVVVDRHRWL